MPAGFLSYLIHPVMEKNFFCIEGEDPPMRLLYEGGDS